MERRKFINNMAIIPVVGNSLFQLSEQSVESKNHSNGKKRTVLFQGDSITFMGRNKDILEANSSLALGRGYAFFAAAKILEAFPELDLQIFNKGIGGNKVFQLAERWEEDCLQLNPDVISVLIGVNDHWHTLDHHNYNGDVNTFKTDYMKLLTRTKAKLPNVKFIIGEPFVLLGGTKVQYNKWDPIFKDYQISVKEIAKTFNAEFIPYQAIFDNALKRAPVSYWAPDGIHPSMAGAELMAKSWFQAFRKISL